ncbi:MAG: hypothetical protein ACXAEU_07815 [Candidatus Hodarchaeales archaeon]|jgi:GGDEF domain-containing protein
MKDNNSLKKGKHNEDVHYPESYGTRVVVFLDLDKFKELTKRHGWTRYFPNPCTATLTRCIEQMTTNFFGSVVWGFNRQEGTEEALIWLNNVNVEDVVTEIEVIKSEIENLGLGCTLSAGVVYSRVSGEDYQPREFKRRNREIFKHPLSFLARKACKKAKKKGGNNIEVDMA